MMAKGIDRPTRSHLCPECLFEVALSKQYLVNPRLPAGDIDIEHHVSCPHNFKAALGNEATKLCNSIGVSFKERLHISSLIENKPVLGIGAQQVEGLSDMRQSLFQILF